MIGKAAAAPAGRNVFFDFAPALAYESAAVGQPGAAFEFPAQSRPTMAPTETKLSAAEADAATLARIRQTIDELDAEMHRSLIERGMAIGTLIKVKGTSRPGAAFRPGREADMMRRLVARHEGALPLWTVEHIWREIITTFTRMQAPFDVAVDQGVARDAMRDTARFLFGFTVALHGQPDASATINHIRESGTDLGLVSADQPAEAGAWWRALGRSTGPRIMALSPYIRIAGRPAAHAAFERGVAELIVSGALLRILQRLVGLVNLLESPLRLFVSRIAVGMAFLGEGSIGGFNLNIGGAPLDAEDLIIIALSHDALFYDPLGEWLLVGEWSQR